jgi:chaperonin GroEL
LEEGIVPGGGIALENAANFLSRHLLKLKPVSFWDKLFGRKRKHNSFDQGYHLALTACRFPAIQICENAGLTWSQWAEGVGVNVKTGDTVNMIEEGIIDPTKVTRCALENAASVASTFLTTSAVVARQQ